ncbi:Plasmodium exported protein (PHISTa), unknown, putative [Plasmodium sp.]|nr:Plasmodium exported protein (PHISTa), unknown, putative [Plasmodium sp.]
MMKKKGRSIYPWYNSDENHKGKLHYISFKFLCISLYVIVFYYVFSNTSLENQTLEIVKNCNVYKRSLGEIEKNNKGSKKKKNIKHKKGDVNKTITNENNTKCNEQMVEGNKCSANIDHGNTNMENKSNSSVSNINYNDLSKNLTEKELFDVLDSLETCPSEGDLRNIWTHTIGVVKEGFDDIHKELKVSIQKYLDNDIYVFTGNNRIWLYKDIWKEINFGLCGTVANVQLKYTEKFYRLISDEHTLDDVLKFIYSFLEHFKTLKKELREKHQKELLQKISETLNKKKK